ncbi:MAG: phosphoglycerate kinase [Pseudodesulfovibrio sp.]|uniref:Phosphoglycerate kinase n=1 Tax=Pseudodesulfovibrio aespoeensis (strain ATCC 700646 / DSM 10631 / Aspo-2) TaxID=643562 RepID=E6VVJ5_PSEA9|nr:MULTISPECIES: phosphoglycerate kinase [Pseudodesulfovibrio]ADU63553.1 Phosphoglycerate kinase [Pseudodesulfovibrio aespoeensis Aspo-2]MBV1764801.1 phosphoglycerate kinase [Pseudodesulfovibrio sp.]MBV1772162.1 phosphoglycerate kinase [Pseudodesulfovibrio sp.]
MLKMTELDLMGKRVLMREDFNVPINNGIITSDKRLRAALPSIRTALNRGAMVILMSHLGRPTSGVFEMRLSLEPVADRLSELLGIPVRFERDWAHGLEPHPGEVIMVENVRFLPGEMSNDHELGRAMASLCDVFVMDAFGTAHRAQASTYAVAQYAPQACAGPLLVQELKALKQGLENPEAPIVAVVGGSKVSTKLTVLKSLLPMVDKLIVGGGIANNFIAAAGFDVCSSLFEQDLVQATRELMDEAEMLGVEIPIPLDVVCAREFSQTATPILRSVNRVAANEMILDIGPMTSSLYSRILEEAGTIVWNGPVGVFEFDQFGQGTRNLSLSIAESPAFSIAGGGDTLAAIEKYNVSEMITYISTGGGAFLEFLEGKTLPAVSILETRAHQ